MIWADSRPFRGGEVKVLYSCSILRDLPLEKKERGTITFYEKGRHGLNDLGLIFRQRSFSGEDDFTVKFRSPGDQPLNPDQDLYRELDHSNRGEVKCETDVNYDPISPREVQSCSFTAPGDNFMTEHFLFMKMMDVLVPDFDGDLSLLRKVSVRSTNWKYHLSEEQQKLSPLSKKPSVERWEFGTECLLEISGKYDGKTKPREAMAFLKNLTPARPAPWQGSKTTRVLNSSSQTL